MTREGGLWGFFLKKKIVQYKLMEKKLFVQ